MRNDSVFWRAVYYIILLLVSVLLLAPPARAQVEVTLDPAMIKGAAGAPVTIVEFSDYQ